LSGSAGNSGGTSTTKTSLPGWLQPYAKLFEGGVASQVFPGIQTPSISGLGIGASGSGGVPSGVNAGGAGSGSSGGFPSLAPYNTALNQNVAGFTPAQTQGMQLGLGQTGAAQSLANQGAATTNNFANGSMLYANANPYTSSYQNQADLNLAQNYALGTQPALMAEFQQAGAFNSPGFNQAQGLAQYGLGQGLASTNTGIANNAYNTALPLTAQAATTGVSQAQQNLYTPGQQAYNIGATQQQQQQNVNNANTANAQQQANWPFNLLSQLGASIGQASGGGGITTSTGPAGTSGGK
jgi:hypothetical protein